MRQVRNNVFETNSSSTHSFSHSKSSYNNLYPEDDGFIYVDLEEFGWGPENHYDSETKLAYALLVAAYLTDHSFWYFGKSTWEEEYTSFRETDLFKKIEQAVIDYLPNCIGIRLNDLTEGYIDHQSLPCGGTFEAWLQEEVGVETVTDFIFGPIVLHVDNDNH